MSLSLRQLPNAICIMRILLILPIVMLMLDGDYQLALFVAVIAGASDGVDGFLAKQFGWQTRLGGLLDPVADKLLLICLFVTLTSLKLTPVWLTAVVLGRDLVIVAGVLTVNFLAHKVHGEPSKVSKLNTFTQLIYVFGVLSHEAFAWPSDMAILLTGAAVLVTSVVSGLGYVLTGIERIRAAKA